MANKAKSCAGSLVFTIFTALLTLTITYAFIPTFFPALEGTPAAWAFTLIFLLPASLFFIVLLLVIARSWENK